MKTDRELLELAAKAAGLLNPQYEQSVVKNWYIYHGDVKDPRECWNPLTDDGDALRLSTELELNIFHTGGKVYAMESDSTWNNEQIVSYRDCNDKHEATRRAIVRVAAQLGKDMP